MFSVFIVYYLEPLTNFLLFFGFGSWFGVGLVLVGGFWLGVSLCGGLVWCFVVWCSCFVGFVFLCLVVFVVAFSQNGWRVLGPDGRGSRVFVVPARSGVFRLRLRDGAAGFVLAHFALWFAECVEPVGVGVLDDWGFAYRPVRGFSVWSNHASGTAMDLNAVRHPLGVRGSFGGGRVRRLRGRLGLRLYGGVVRWGGDFRGRADEMHFELCAGEGRVGRVARGLLLTPRGRRLLRANPGLRAAVLS